ncbi:hypothetical protein HPB51_013721 [Rhipicephalus microplus]|uniref:Rhodanese domain-containing protein n=1 Tax=Rhipicephalus microplus TaxID=6941 RepID=A0A9J6F4D3_RHIMP|nr:hypothetical protein HPB51_013721 [Rhipicephalus microplus]
MRAYDAQLCIAGCDYEEVKDLLEKGKAFFVDVRELKELVNDGRIPGCVNIPLNEVGAALELPPEKFKEKYGRDKPSPDDPNVIFSCRKGVRATSAMQTAHARGYHAARFYRGSFCDWEQRGGEEPSGLDSPPGSSYELTLLDQVRLGDRSLPRFTEEVLVRIWYCCS